MSNQLELFMRYIEKFWARGILKELVHTAAGVERSYHNRS